MTYRTMRVTYLCLRIRGSHYLTMEPEPSSYHFASLYSPMFNMQSSASLCLQFNYYLKTSSDGIGKRKKQGNPTQEASSCRLAVAEVQRKDGKSCNHWCYPFPQ
ncbi:hypothetical protein OSTOST_11329, partial [Ostertagia ostertagi]